MLRRLTHRRQATRRANGHKLHSNARVKMLDRSTRKAQHPTTTQVPRNTHPHSQPYIPPTPPPLTRRGAWANARNFGRVIGRGILREKIKTGTLLCETFTAPPAMAHRISIRFSIQPQCTFGASSCSVHLSSREWPTPHARPT